MEEVKYPLGEIIFGRAVSTLTEQDKESWPRILKKFGGAKLDMNLSGKALKVTEVQPVIAVIVFTL